MLIQKSTELKIKLDPQSRIRVTVLHMACEIGHIEMAKLLIQKSAELNIDLNAKNCEENTPLFLLVKKLKFHVQSWNQREIKAILIRILNIITWK